MINTLQYNCLKVLTECWCVLPLQSVENLPTVFGSNSKAQTAAKTVFNLAHRHGNILREGWKNIMESMLQLFRAELLPKAMGEGSALLQTSEHSYITLVSDWILSAAEKVCGLPFLNVLLPPAVQCSHTMLVASGGGFCGTKWENFSSKRGNSFKSVWTDLICHLLMYSDVLFNA